MNPTLAKKAEKAAADFCAYAEAYTAEVRAAGIAAIRARRRAAEAAGAPGCETRAEAAAAAAETARRAAARAEALLDFYEPNPDGAGPTWEAVMKAHMTLDTAARVALQAADQAAKLA
jgi:hypothetical protein